MKRALTSRPQRCPEELWDDFKEFIEKNKDEIAALQIIYSKPYDIRELTFRDIKELADAIEKPPHSLTPERLWRAYQRLDKSKVRDNPKKMLTDLISIVRFTLGHELELIPFDAEIDERFKKWLAGSRISREEVYTGAEEMACYDQGSHCDIDYGYDGRH